MSLGGQALGALGRLRERELMQDATTSESEREMTLTLMSSSAGGALMALLRIRDCGTGFRSLGGRRPLFAYSRH